MPFIPSGLVHHVAAAGSAGVPMWELLELWSGEEVAALVHCGFASECARGGVPDVVITAAGRVLRSRLLELAGKDAPRGEPFTLHAAPERCTCGAFAELLPVGPDGARVCRACAERQNAEGLAELVRLFGGRR